MNVFVTNISYIDNITVDFNNIRILPFLLICIKYLMCVYLYACIQNDVLYAPIYQSIFTQIVTSILHIYQFRCLNVLLVNPHQFYGRFMDLLSTVMTDLKDTCRPIIHTKSFCFYPRQVSGKQNVRTCVSIILHLQISSDAQIDMNSRTVCLYFHMSTTANEMEKIYFFIL